MAYHFYWYINTSTREHRLGNSETNGSAEDKGENRHKYSTINLK